MCYLCNTQYDRSHHTLCAFRNFVHHNRNGSGFPCSHTHSARGEMDEDFKGTVDIVCHVCHTCRFGLFQSFGREPRTSFIDHALCGILSGIALYLYRIGPNLSRRCVAHQIYHGVCCHYLHGDFARCVQGFPTRGVPCGLGVGGCGILHTARHSHHNVSRTFACG